MNKVPKLNFNLHRHPHSRGLVVRALTNLYARRLKGYLYLLLDI